MITMVKGSRTCEFRGCVYDSVFFFMCYGENQPIDLDGTVGSLYELVKLSKEAEKANNLTLT